MKTFLKLIRIKHWIKNLFVFAPLFFAKELFLFDKIISTILAFFSITFISVLIYIINDIKDRKSDSVHSIKKERPIAAGIIKPFNALLVGFLFAIIGIIILLFLDKYSKIIIAAYFVINILYTYYLKNITILDVFIIAVSFCLRVLLGATVIYVHLSYWMLFTTFTVSLIIGFGKRRHELELLKNEATSHRINLKNYTKNLLDILIMISTSLTIINYTLYTMDHEVTTKFGTGGLILTVPFVIYGLFRYLLLIYCRDKGGSPEELVVTDIGIILTVTFWFLVLMLQIYFKDILNLFFLKFFN
jgi:decaprenyl-phosphate phosphoribosyltransferase